MDQLSPKELWERDKNIAAALTDPNYHMSDQQVAINHLGYGFSDEETATEFHRRNPYMAGWKAAAFYLLTQHKQRPLDLNTPITTDDIPPSYDTLMAVYRKRVERIAAGE